MAIINSTIFGGGGGIKEGVYCLDPSIAVGSDTASHQLVKWRNVSFTITNADAYYLEGKEIKQYMGELYVLIITSSGNFYYKVGDNEKTINAKLYVDYDEYSSTVKQVIYAIFGRKGDSYFPLMWQGNFTNQSDKQEAFTNTTADKYGAVAANPYITVGSWTNLNIDFEKGNALNIKYILYKYFILQIRVYSSLASSLYLGQASLQKNDTNKSFAAIEVS